MKNFSIALDIGTTNISSALVDIDKKMVVANLDKPNEQIIYGDDIITRLKFATTESGKEKLNEKIINSINSLMDFLTSRAKISKNYVKKILAVGNAAIYHLTLFLPVDTLARAPFSPFETSLVRKKAKDIGLKDFKEAEFIFLPNIGGFVGSDALGVIVATDMHKKEGIRLAIDLGTNGEVILGNNKKILVSSTAAGPAFEGWHISCGTRPRPGAIIDFEIKKDKITIKTLGNIPPNGIASSGLIKITNTLIDKGYVDKTGRLLNNDEFVIYKNNQKKVYLNQKDVREIQLAKSAIQTAISLLVSSYDIGYNDISEVIVTGRFGGALNKNDIVKIGIVPQDLKEKNFKFKENLALEGATLILVEDRLSEINSILKITKHIELHRERKFQDEFTKRLHFAI